MDQKERGSSIWMNIVFLKKFNYENVIRKFVFGQFLILTMGLGLISRWIILLYWEKVLTTKRHMPLHLKKVVLSAQGQLYFIWIQLFMPIVTRKIISSS